MAPTVAVLAGATGLVGRYLLQILLEDALYDSIIALTRRPLDTEHPRLRQHIVDFDTFDGSEWGPVTHFYSTLGTTIRKAGSKEAFERVDHQLPLRLARSARRQGATRMALVSSVGAKTDSPNFYLQVKGRLEADLQSLGWDGLYLFQPSFLLGSRAETRPGEKIGIALARTFEWALTGGLRKYRPMPAPVLAQAMTNAMEREPGGVHTYLYDGICGLAR